jgi:hypothetical protein
MCLGKDKRAVLLAVALLFSASSSGQTGNKFKYQLDGDLKESDITIGKESLVINYSISELDLENIFIDKDSYFRIRIPGHVSSTATGMPELPVLSRLITVPEGAVIKVNISNVRSTRINPAGRKIRGILFPTQEGETKNDLQKKRDFKIDKKTYSSRGIISSDTVSVEYVGIARNNRLANLYISPVRYNPHSNVLEVITSMKIEITFTSSNGNSLKSLESGSTLFNESFQESLLNYTNSDLIPGFTDKPVKMVIITDTAFKKQLAPFIKWKTQKGYKVKVLYRGTGLAGNTYTQLKDTLTKIYKAGTIADPAPEYLLIVGDVDRIPFYGNGAGNITDMYYGEFNGNGDYIPEMFVGRLPVADTSEVKSVVSKIIQYEKFQFADTNKFYTKALVMAGNDVSYSNIMNGQVKYAIQNYINSANKIKEYYFYSPETESYNATKDSLSKLINKGLSFINYTGHGAAEGWLYTTKEPLQYYLKSSEIPLANKNMYPFIISNACRTSQFNLSSSLGNTMVVNSEKGAVGFIGCSNDSYWDEDFFWAVGSGVPSASPTYQTTGLGAYDRLFHSHGETPSNWYFTMGQINYAGNLSVSASASRFKKYYWETYNLVGDPSVIPIIGNPGTFAISLPDTLPNNLKTLSLNLEPFAYVAVSHFDTLWDASYSSPSGSVTLHLPGLSNDSCLIVITGQNKIPKIKTIRFAEVKNAFINLTSSAINDSTANNNGLADYSESISLRLIINNLGQTGSSGFYAKLSTTSNQITINSDSVFIGNISAKSQIILNRCFNLSIADMVPDKSYITLNLSLGDSKTVKNYTIDLTLHSPVLEIINCLIDDSGTGNSNNLAEPGETFKLLFKVTNTGSSNISGTFNIPDHNPKLTVFQSVINTGTLKPGVITIIPVTVKLASDFPVSGSVNISTFLDCSKYTKSKTFIVPVGKTRESFEYQKMTILPWINSKTFPWVISNTQAIDGEYSARSGIIANNAESVLKMLVNVPAKDTVKFNVKVSSELNYDFLGFKLNGTQIFALSGEEGWTEKKIAVKEGINLLEWIYKKDQTQSSGADCAWLDNIIFPFNAFNKVDLKTGKVVTPQPNKSYAMESITAEVINFGTDTIKSFNLAYQINNNNPVIQNFSRKISPGDTAIVAFSQPADLAVTGAYMIKVFGLNNNDAYPLNDTAKMSVLNTSIFSPPDNPENTIKISPNPFRQSFSIDIESDYSEKILISILDQSGKVLWTKNIMVLPGSNPFTVTPEGLPSGLFILKIFGRHNSQVARIIRID